jgi:tripartite-type tricarboxylate transporter receptor subunit TctC
MPPDGYNLLFGSADGLAIVPVMKKKAPYDPVKDFTPVAMVAKAPLVFAVNSKFAPNSLAELIAYAKSKPGAVRYGSAGVGSLLHLGVELLQSATGTDMVHVPYKGGGPMMTDVVAGQIEMVMTAADFAKRFADSGQLKVLAQADTSRHALLPNIPTVGEVGMPNILVVSWFGVLGPAGLPGPVVDRLGRELAATIKDPALQEKLVQVGANVSYLPAGPFASHIADENRRWDRVVKEAKVPLLD